MNIKAHYNKLLITDNEKLYTFHFSGHYPVALITEDGGKHVMYRAIGSGRANSLASRFSFSVPRIDYRTKKSAPVHHDKIRDMLDDLLIRYASMHPPSKCIFKRRFNFASLKLYPSESGLGINIKVAYVNENKSLDRIRIQQHRNGSPNYIYMNSEENRTLRSSFLYYDKKLFAKKFDFPPLRKIPTAELETMMNDTLAGYGQLLALRKLKA